jgi:cell division protein FtsB
VAKPHRGKRIVQILATVFAIVLMVDAIVGDRGLLAQRRASREYEALTRALELKRMENARLQEEARRLKSDPTAIEELARRELGLIRPGEKVFIVKDLKTASGN